MAPDLDVGPPRDPASVRAAAQRILAEPQFRQPPESIIDRIRHWVGNQIARILNDVVSGHLGVIGGVILAVIVAATVWLIVRASRQIARDPTVRGFVLGGPVRRPDDWLRDAAAFEASGDWRSALIARYRALVAELGRRGVVDEVPGRTSGEYRHEVAHSLPQASDAFDGATDLFELSRYGGGQPGPDDTASLRQLSDRVLARTR